MSALRSGSAVLRLGSGEGDRAAVERWLGSGMSVYSTIGPALLRDCDVRTILDPVMLLMVHPSSPHGPPAGALWWNRGAHLDRYELHCVLGDLPVWRSGVGSDAVRLALGYLFHSLGAHRVSTTVGVFNEPVAELVSECGFTCEGLLRDHYYLDGAHQDAAVCSILRDEYDATIGDGALVRVPAAEKERARRQLAEYMRTGSGVVLARLNA